MNAAKDKLGLIHEEAIRLSNRMNQLDSVLKALKPFLKVESATKQVPANGCTPQKVGIAVPGAVPPKMIESADPIQSRISSALGLALA